MTPAGKTKTGAWRPGDDGPNPVIAEPEPQAEKTYTVCGPHRVLGHEPGSTFAALLAPEQQAALIEGGHIIPVNRKGS